MPWSGGTYTRSNGTYSGSTVWQSDAAAAVKIRADRHDTHDQDIATGINNCLTKDGQNSPTQNIGWGGFKITGLGNGTATTDAAAYGQTITALAWSGSTITATRSAGNLTIAVSSANITGALGYTPINKAGDSGISGGLGLSLGTYSAGAPLSVTGALSGAARTMTFVNTDTSNGALMGVSLQAGAGSANSIAAYAPSYTPVTAFTGRLALEDTNSGIAYSALGASGDHKWHTGASRTLRMTLSSAGDLTLTGAITVTGAATIGGGKKLSKITLATAAPGVLADGELYLRY